MKKKTIFLLSILLISCVIYSYISNTRNGVKKEVENTTSYGKQWWIDDAKNINIKSIWEKTSGKEEIVIGVIDSGVDISNKYLSSSIFINKNEIPDNGIDDDGNGFIDDINGWNFYDESNEVYTSYVNDFHGTMIAGLIAGNHVENQYYGVAPNVRILPLKCFRGNKGGAEDVVKAIEYGYNLGVRIFNCSWATSNYYNDLYNTIKKYNDAIFICASGNDGIDTNQNKVYPGMYGLENIICVGGINKDGTLYEYSGTGNEVDIYAPANEIYCVMPENTSDYGSGTSFATAIVSGSTALMKSINQELSVTEMVTKIKNNKQKSNILDVGWLCEN